MLTDIIYNHVSKGRGRLLRLEGVGFASNEEHSHHKYIECIMNQREDIAIGGLLIN